MTLRALLLVLLALVMNLHPAVCVADDPGVNDAGGNVPPRLTADKALSAAEKKLHRRQLKEHRKALRKVRKKEAELLVLLERLGASPSRAARDALIEFAADKANVDYVAFVFVPLAKRTDRVAIEFLCGPHGVRSSKLERAFAAQRALSGSENLTVLKLYLACAEDPEIPARRVGSILISLARLAPDDARVDALAHKMSSDRRDNVRGGALEALGEIGNDKAVARLKAAALTDDSPLVRARVCDGIEATGRKTLIPLLEQMEREDASHYVRKRARRAADALAKD